MRYHGAMKKKHFGDFGGWISSLAEMWVLYWFTFTWFGFGLLENCIHLSPLCCWGILNIESNDIHQIHIHPEEIEFLDHTLNPRETQSGRRILANLAEINSIATSSALISGSKNGIRKQWEEHTQA